MTWTIKNEKGADVTSQPGGSGLILLGDRSSGDIDGSGIVLAPGWGCDAFTTKEGIAITGDHGKSCVGGGVALSGVVGTSVNTGYHNSRHLAYGGRCSRVYANRVAVAGDQSIVMVGKCGVAVVGEGARARGGDKAVLVFQVGRPNLYGLNKPYIAVVGENGVEADVFYEVQYRFESTDGIVRFTNFGCYGLQSQEEGFDMGVPTLVKSSDQSVPETITELLT